MLPPSTWNSTFTTPTSSAAVAEITMVWNTVAPAAGKLSATVGGVWSAMGSPEAIAPLQANSRAGIPNAKTCTSSRKALLLPLGTRGDRPDPFLDCTVGGRSLFPRAGGRRDSTSGLRLAADSDDAWRKGGSGQGNMVLFII